MKRRTKHRKAPATAGRVPPSPLPPARRWLYRLAALVLVPLALLLALEGILRVAYPGYPTRFFLPTQRNGTNLFITNDRYGLRFFPPAIARSPTPYAFPARKAAGTLRIFLFGESAALGDPRPAFGVGRYLQVLLEERFPDRRFEVIPAAMTAINSHALRDIAEECRGYEGDLWIVYAGNNEMAGPFGAVTVFGPKTPGLPAIRASLALRTTRTGQWIEALTRRLQEGGSAPPRWEGMQMFLDQQLPPGDPRAAIVRHHFQSNLGDIVQAGTSAGVPVLLSTVGSNLRDWAPFAAAHPATFNPADTNRWNQWIAQADAQAASGDLVAARKTLAETELLDKTHAELRFRQGRIALALTNAAEARDHFRAARDYDALPFRTDSALNRIIHEAASAAPAGMVSLVDAETALAQMAGEGIPGEEQFLDHVHLTFAGNYQLARLFAEQVAGRLRLVPDPATSPEWASQETVERRLALTDWNRVTVLETMLQRFSEPPFTRQLYHRERLLRLALRISELRQQLHPRLYLETRDLYDEAIRRAPEDPRLRENYAEFLETSGSPEEALKQWAEVGRLLPGHHAALFHQGRICSRLNRPEEARRFLSQALAIRPDLDEARLEMGQSWFRQGRHEEALAVYTDLRQRVPRDARVLRYMAEPLAATGRRPEAMEALREAIRIRPTYSEAHYFLGVELAVDGKVEEARREFEDVLRVRPDHVLARLNLGVALARGRRFEEARKQFEAVLRLEPENASARQHLQTLDSMLQRQGQPTDAPR